MIERVILDLCGGSGEWGRPYREAGYDVRTVDYRDGNDVRLVLFPGKVHGILAAPPCTHLSVSGARWWKDKGEDKLLEAMSVVDACLRLVVVCSPEWWALENPVGRLKDFIGGPTYSFDPCNHGDNYTKKTLIWGRFRPPMRQPALATERSKMHLMAPSEDRAALRSITPAGFARAFFEANP